jgi:hypothetical protein
MQLYINKSCYNKHVELFVSGQLKIISKRPSEFLTCEKLLTENDKIHMQSDPMHCQNGSHGQERKFFSLLSKFETVVTSR